MSPETSQILGEAFAYFLCVVCPLVALNVAYWSIRKKRKAHR